MHQIVTNLLDNACKYTQAGGKVHVALNVEGASAVLTNTVVLSASAASENRSSKEG